MLLQPRGGALAQSIETVLEALPDAMRTSVSSETHSAAVELTTGVHATVADAVHELGALR
jgi:gamma-glutamyl:cysteine ligase YbdK (ATP-grasp superfamily)